MIIIYNLSGLLLGLAGIAAGLLVGLATRHLSLGLLAMALVWSIFGWRRVDPVTQTKRPFPSVFFIPLAFIGILLVLASVPMFLVERVVRNAPRDPRAALLDADESTLRQFRVGGDAALSNDILEHLASIVEEKGAKVEDYHVFTRVGSDAVLVLVQVPNLKQYEPEAREQLLNFIEGMLWAEERVQGKKLYIGVKGRVAYGALRGPNDFTKTGAAVSERPLYEFYGAGPATVPATNTAPATTTPAR